MKWGARQRAWQKLYNEGRDPPAAFYDLDPPEVWSWLQYIWDAFHILGTERPIGMALGPIPASKIRDYAAGELDLDRTSEEADRFFDLIRRMDDEYRDDQDKAQSQSNKSAQIDPNDSAGMVALFRTIENRKKHEKKRAARRERMKR